MDEDTRGAKGHIDRMREANWWDRGSDDRGRVEEESGGATFFKPKDTGLQTVGGDNP